jgi:hypothetical protein
MIPNIGSDLFCGAFPPIRVFWEIGRVATPVEVSFTHRNLRARSLPTQSNAPPPEVHIDYSNSQVLSYADYLYSDPDYPIEIYAL